MTERIEVTNPEAYRQKLSGLLDGREPIEVLSETPARLRNLFQGRTTEQVRHRPFEGKWTPQEVVGHLIDAEWSFAWRLRTVLGDDQPEIQPMDQDRWVEAQAYNQADLAELLDDFESIRWINLRLWSRLSPAELQRVGLHQERGEESLETMRMMLAGHDLSHLDQIERYLAAIG